jgi:hypothetical protein
MLFAVLAIILMSLSFVSADLIIAGDADYSASHDSTLPINIRLNNTGADTNFSQITLAITNITNISHYFPVTITDANKLAILQNSSKEYTINYPISKYLAPGSYNVKINATANNSATNETIASIKQITVNVNTTQKLDVSGTMSLIINHKVNKSNIITIQNTGNVDLTITGLSQDSILRDSENRTINLTIAMIGSDSLLTPGKSVDLNITAYASPKMATGTYSTTLQILTSAGYVKNSTLTFELATSYCEFGEIGQYFDFEIKEPDDNDDFYPYQNIEIRARVTNDENDDRDIVISANIYDITDAKFLDEEVSEDFTIDEDSSEDFYLTLTLPSDIDESHEYRIYVKVYDDDEGEKKQCNDDYVKIDINRKTHDLTLNQVEIPDKVECGKTAEIIVKISNTGKKDEEAKIRVYNTDLGIDVSKTLNIDFGDTEQTTLTFSVPKDIDAGIYNLNLKVSYLDKNNNYLDADGDAYSLNIQGNCVASNLILSAVSEQGYVNEQLAVTISLFNSGNAAETYTLSASNYDSWASLNKIEPLSITLDKGQAGSALVYLTPKNVTGAQTFKVKAMYGSKIVEKEVSVTVKEKASIVGFWQRVSNRLSNYSGLDLTTVNIILIIAIIILIFWILRIRRG